MREGKLTDALRLLNPKKKSGPWTVLCDGESFLRANKSRAAYAFKKINLWTVPPKSPDLNPIEMFWGWIRKKLRKIDLGDFRNKCTPLNKAAYITRVKGVMRSHKAQTVPGAAPQGSARRASKLLSGTEPQQTTRHANVEYARVLVNVAVERGA